MSTKYKIKMNGKIYEVEVEKGEAQLLDTYDVPTAPAPVAAAPVPAAAVQAAPAPAVAPVPAPAAPAPVAMQGEAITAPFPGAVISVKVEPGQAVKKGELVLILEAMKMENEVFSPRDATIGKILVSQGNMVNTGDPLVTLV